MRAEQQYIDLFSQCEAMICRHSAEVLNAPRAQAFADFEKLGFPTRKQEKYKYTDVSKLFEPDYGLNLNRLDIPVNPYEVFKCDVPNMSTALYFVVNDAFYRKALPKAQLPEGVLLGSLKELSEQYPDLVKQYYGKLADTSKDGVTAFNTAFAQDGFMLYVPKGVVVEKPIQLVNILRADVNFMVNRRVLVVLEEGAQARLLICDHAMDNVNFLSTQVIEVFAEENTTFDLYELEETHTSTVRFNNLYVNQEADSNVLLNGMTLHNGTTRNTTEVTLAGRGARSVCVVWSLPIRMNRWTIILSLTTRFPIASVMSCSNMYWMIRQWVRLPEKSWYVKGRNILIPNKPTVTFVLLVMPTCTPSHNWKFMRMM